MPCDGNSMISRATSGGDGAAGGNYPCVGEFPRFGGVNDAGRAFAKIRIPGIRRYRQRINGDRVYDRCCSRATGDCIVIIDRNALGTGSIPVYCNVAVVCSSSCSDRSTGRNAPNVTALT